MALKNVTAKAKTFHKSPSAWRSSLARVTPAASFFSGS